MESACAGCFFVMILAHLYRFFETDVLSSQHNFYEQGVMMTESLDVNFEITLLKFCPFFC
jgi:hypothetical protein